MATDTRKIREFIGNDQIEAAMDALIDLIEPREADSDLLDQVILQKGRWAECRRKEMAGFGNETEVNRIRDSLLKITRDLDKRGKESVPDELKADPVPRTPDLPPPVNSSQYIAQCFFNGDVNQYFVLPNNQIIAVNPLTNYSVAVATRTASMNPGFAWVYQFPNGMYYSIDHNGAIWGVNAFGMPMQMGYVQYF